MPICNRCQEDLPNEYFSVKNKRTTKLQPYCKICQNKYSAAHYKANKQNYIDRKRKRVANLANILNEYKEQKGCKYCSEKTACCLDFHHLRDKISTVSLLKSFGATNKMWSEIEKCDVVCSNCHRKIHAGLIIAKG